MKKQGIKLLVTGSKEGVSDSLLKKIEETEKSFLSNRSISNAPIIPSQIPEVESNGKSINNPPKHIPLFLINLTRLNIIKLERVIATPIAKKMNRPILDVISKADTIVPINKAISISLNFLIFSPPLQVLVYHLLTFNPIMNSKLVHQT